MKINKTHSQNGKKYNVIIKVEENIVEGKEYPTIFKEVKMSNKAPVWFTNWTTEFEKKNDARWERQEQFNKEMIEFKHETLSRLDNLEKDMKQVKQDIVLIKNCPTIKAELQHST